MKLTISFLHRSWYIILIFYNIKFAKEIILEVQNISQKLGKVIQI
jgi:hypothetical protein